jgi:hypothetical protein
MKNQNVQQKECQLVKGQEKMKIFKENAGELF